nr:zinc ribbon domain-containing protein [uncultured Merdimonas sp.]
MSRLCPHCGVEMKEGAKFCSRCGYEYDHGKICPNCHATIKDDAQFCTNCGYRFNFPSKTKNRLLILIISVIILASIITIWTFSDSSTDEESLNNYSNTFVDIEDFKELFCSKIGIDYNSSEWSTVESNFTDTEGYASYFTLDYMTIVLMYEKDSGNIREVGIGIDSLKSASGMLESGVEEIVSTQLLWESTAVSIMADCNMEDAEEIVRSANKAADGGKQESQYENLIIRPYEEISSGNYMFSIYDSNAIKD